MLFVVSVPLVSGPSVPSLQLPRLPLRSTLSMRVLISIPRSLVPVSRSSAKTFSVVLSNQLRRSFTTPRSIRVKYMRLSLLAVLLVFPVSSNLYLTSSTERNPTRASTLTRLLLMVLLCRLLSFLVILQKRLKIYSYSMLPPYPLGKRFVSTARLEL